MHRRLCCCSYARSTAVVRLCAIVLLLLPIASQAADNYGFLKPVSAAEARYVGPGSCSATACHGSVQARQQTKALQNEYSTWVLQAKHARPWNVRNNSPWPRIPKTLGPA